MEELKCVLVEFHLVMGLYGEGDSETELLNYGGAAEVLEVSFNVTARASSKVTFSKV